MAATRIARLGIQRQVSHAPAWHGPEGTAWQVWNGTSRQVEHETTRCGRAWQSRCGWPCSVGLRKAWDRRRRAARHGSARHRVECCGRSGVVGRGASRTGSVGLGWMGSARQSAVEQRSGCCGLAGSARSGRQGSPGLGSRGTRWLRFAGHGSSGQSLFGPAWVGRLGSVRQAGHGRARPATARSDQAGRARGGRGRMVEAQRGRSGPARRGVARQATPCKARKARQVKAWQERQGKVWPGAERLGRDRRSGTRQARQGSQGPGMASSGPARHGTAGTAVSLPSLTQQRRRFTWL